MVETHGNSTHATDGVQTGVAPVPVTMKGAPENLDSKVREPSCLATARLEACVQLYSLCCVVRS